MTPRLATPPEPIWYPLPGEDAESPQWQTASFEGILASAFEANQLGADMLKVEFPGYVDSQPGRDNAVAACKELDAGVNVPWVIRPGKSALAEAVAERNLSPGSCGGTYRCLMRLLSVNVGKPFPNPWKPVALTGIDKRPVSGPVMVTAPGPKGTGAVGLAGDRVYDVKHHGGPDQAVYAYAREDLDMWEAELDTPLHNGVFGENLTTEGIDINSALIGERWRLGHDVILEVCCPRIPCGTFQGWLARADWIKRFTEAARPGAYLRVIDPGQIRAGDSVRIEHRPDHDVTVAVAFRALTIEPDLLPRLPAADALPEEVKDLARKRT